MLNYSLLWSSVYHNRSCPTLFLNNIFEGFLDENQIKNQFIVVLWTYFLLQFVVKNRQKDA
jgi:hypothetical protein